MKQYKLIREFEKKEYFQENTPRLKGVDFTNFDVQCLHCGETINPNDYKVELQVMTPRKLSTNEKIFNARLGIKPTYSAEPEEFIVCPNSPNCDGTVIDWVLRDKTK